jgi:hypothetical protein
VSDIADFVIWAHGVAQAEDAALTGIRGDVAGPRRLLGPGEGVVGRQEDTRPQGEGQDLPLRATR